jgi:hypothetical protein
MTEEAALAAQLSEVLAEKPLRRGPEAHVKPHVSFANVPEAAVPVPSFRFDPDGLVPPPLPMPDYADDAAEDAAHRLPVGLRHRPSPAVAPWVARGRRTRSRRPGTILAWLVTLIIVGAVLVGAACAVLGVPRVMATAAEAASVAQSAFVTAERWIAVNWLAR